MSRFRLSLIAGALVALVAACDEAAAPKGTPGDLTVRAYVDRDASGTFTTGDSALAGMLVTATPVGAAMGGAQLSATTDASGQAVFQDLAPGSYMLRLNGTEPAGAILTTNPTPTIGVSSQGTISGSTEFRFSFFPGTVSGRIFRDDDNSGGFTTGDAVGAGLTVRLRADTGQAGAVVATTTTDNSGQFNFSLVAPGSYWVELENPTTISYGTAGALRRVTVGPQGTIAVPAVFTGSLVIPIAEARARATGQAVAVIGNVTAAPGSFTSGTNGVNSEIWVQDASGGIAVFSVPTANASQFPIGQRVQVSGTRGANAGQTQIANPGLSVTALTGSTVIAPRTITGEQLNARTFDGQLGRITGITVDSIGTTTSTSFTVFGKAPDGQVVQVRVIGPTSAQTNTGLTRANFTTGQRYDVTGLLTVFTSGSTTVAQIKPRMTSDVVAAPVTTPARIIINEFMANPATTTDPAGEYIELYNAGGTAQDISGWRINDYTGAGAIGGVDTIGVSTPMGSPILIQPGQHFLMVHTSTAAGTLPGSAALYRYKAAIQLNNSGTERLVLKDANGVTVDSVAFTAPVGTAAGIARGVVNPALENADASVNWADQTTVFITGERGTPGQRNDGFVTAASGPFLRTTITAAPAVAPPATTRAPDGAKSNRR